VPHTSFILAAPNESLALDETATDHGLPSVTAQHFRTALRLSQEQAARRPGFYV
jgi:hypothetical protein